MEQSKAIERITEILDESKIGVLSTAQNNELAAIRWIEMLFSVFCR